jgi:GT2 family glycosyltransferase
LRALATLPAEVVSDVVENASTDDSVTIAERLANQMVRLGINSGFSKACNTGAAMAETEFLLMMNPDSEIDGDAIEAPIDTADRHPKAAGINPRFVSSVRNWKSPPAPLDDRRVTTLSGAALFVRKALRQSTG